MYRFPRGRSGYWILAAVCVGTVGTGRFVEAGETSASRSPRGLLAGISAAIGGQSHAKGGNLPVRQAAAVAHETPLAQAANQAAEDVSPTENLPREAGFSGHSVDAPSSNLEPGALVLTDLKPLASLTVNVQPPAGDLPPNLAGPVFQALGQAPGDQPMGRGWLGTGYYWTAPGVCHRPLYFEEINLERHGHSYGIFQPAVSAAHFFVTVPALPYLTAVENPHHCVYTLGHDRPGSCAAWQDYLPPWQWDAAALETGLIIGLVFLIP